MIYESLANVAGMMLVEGCYGDYKIFPLTANEESEFFIVNKGLPFNYDTIVRLVAEDIEDVVIAYANAVEAVDNFADSWLHTDIEYGVYDEEDFIDEEEEEVVKSFSLRCVINGKEVVNINTDDEFEFTKALKFAIHNPLYV